MRHGHRRSRWRSLVALATAAALAGGGLAVAAAPATAAVPQTKIWQGKAGGAPAPDSGYSDFGNALFTFEDPESLQASTGDEISINFTGACWVDTSEDRAPDLQFEVNGDPTDVNVDGSWTSGFGMLSNYTGTVTFAMPAVDATLLLKATDSKCVLTPAYGALVENVYTFTNAPAAFECPAFPGVALTEIDDDELPSFVVTDPVHGYTTAWELDDDGVIDDQVGSLGDVEYQSDAFDGFSEFASTEASDESDFNNECLKRNAPNADDWAAGTFGDLLLTTQNHYFDTADLVRRSWTFTNDTGSMVEGFDVTLQSNWGSDDDTEELLITDWGQVSGDGGDEDPVVTMLWGGDSTSILDVNRLPSARIAADYATAVADSKAWLESVDDLSDEYLAGVPGDGILNWGASAETPSVVRGDSMDDEDRDRVYTTYSVPALADGESITVVEFAHVQYFDYPVPAWVDTVVANGVIGQVYSDGVAGPQDDSYVYFVDEGELPAGLQIDDATGAITGTPTGPAGCSTFTIGVEGDDDEYYDEFTICITEATVPGEEAAPVVLDLKLDFEVGTKIADAKTLASANGLLADSAWTLTMYSTPRVIGSGQTSSAGTISQPVSLPLDTPAGAHRLVLAGTSPAGVAVTDEAWFALSADGVITAISYTGPVSAEAGLASTGAGFVAPGLVMALLAMLAGAGALVYRRRMA